MLTTCTIISLNSIGCKEKDRKEEELPVYLSLRTKKGAAEPEVYFRVLYLTEPNKREILEQEVEIALGPRVAELLRKALEWQRLLETGQITSQAEIARQEGLTRARVTQILSLNNLASKIQEYILSMPDMVEMPTVTERSLRPISGIEDPRRQAEEFEELASR